MDTKTERELLGGLLQATHLIEKTPTFSKLIPEVRTNIVYCQPNETDPKKVAAINGRITTINGKPKASGKPKIGCSDHMARALIEIKKHRPEIQAGINLRYNKQTTKAIKKTTNTKIGKIDRQKEPTPHKKGEKKSMPWKIKYLHQKYGEIPDIFYETPGLGKEPLYVYIGKDPYTLTKKTIKISKNITKHTHKT
ncbi:Thiamin biosynthesis enzyme aldolase 2 family [Methanonatronarchaeum thermophilum]|uniref:Thiamin biosynthesis enzyme aldolase 2 family n=1 Tax=Methanonatronarchaeum thermophilum TaxID=1927129 RepID=A0A1Y3GGV8_9EURY|nr:thiamine-phosphate synthase family protein [Methanonatronarchaeum thermophilum]OUJ19543.1 Thiamin biosynthesis enzyme aldolase 2 family [Methanonatronarchaeum thermophilum]